ncbi:unnamed protein product [Dovyalis caffra]|uniref:Protein kinase domain-containing protein n=1 Tax=Dovyalis caffra TaxID=77055 RepID=A0AAV1SSZ6_9ROSI|nr:unnamed protein product [Dovyalis caffra]
MVPSFYSSRTSNICIISFLLLLLLPFVNSISLKRTRFDPTDTSIIYEGGASAYVGTIEFNSDTYMCQVGRATYASKNHIVHIEFDSFANFDWDPPIQHVGINNNSISSATYTYWNTSLHRGDTADVWITYNSTTKNLTVSWKYQTTSAPQENTSLSYIIDLREVLPEWVTIGFTAATSNLIEQHVLQSWEFSSTLEMSETRGKDAKKMTLEVSLAVSGAVLIAVIAVVSGILWRRKLNGNNVLFIDVKSSNIMLDPSFNVKLGDFGLAPLMDHELGPQPTGLAGTIGYLAPEYISTGRASKESDVYSFGVVALEIATGRKAVDTTEQNSEMSLVEWIWDLYGIGKLNLAVDEKLQSDFDDNQMECLMIVGIRKHNEEDDMAVRLTTWQPHHIADCKIS